MSFNKSSFTAPSSFPVQPDYQALGLVTPEMFGAVGDGVADDTAAIQSAVNFCLASGYQSLRGLAQYALSGPVDISNFVVGTDFYFNKIVCHSSFPSPAHWNSATPFFTIGANGGTQVGIQLECLRVDGASKADIVQVINNGVGGSWFKFGYTSNTNINYVNKDTTAQTASNYVLGNYWTTGIQAANIIKGSAGTPEGTTLDVGFISGFKYGGIVLGDGASYTNIRGQLDFNGTWLTQFLVPSTAGFAIGDTVTDTTNAATAEVLAVYTTHGQAFLLVIETKDTGGGNSNFVNGHTITNGTASTTITTLQTTNQGGNNIYYDIIQAYPNSAPFSRNTIIAPYLGGIVGNCLFTNFLQSANSNNALTNSNQGFMVTNNGAGQISFYNRFLSDTAPFLDVTTALFAIGGSRDIFMPSSGISNGNNGINVPNGVTTDLATIPAVGANGGVYLYNCVAPGTSAINSFGIVYLPAGSGAAQLTELDHTNLHVTLSGRTLQGIQGTGSDWVVITNILRISLT
jgi:hypothetical protein